jgi:hypothetical protein
MSARELAMLRTRRQLHTAAIGRARVRVRGVVAERGGGYSGTYRNVWLLIATAGVSVRVTASPSTPLGTMAVGSTVELAARLTGLVDVAADVFHAERAQLLAWVPETDQGRLLGGFPAPASHSPAGR